MLPRPRWIRVLAVAAGTGLAATGASAQDWRSITTQRTFAGEQSLRVDLEYGAGRLTIGPGSDNSLYRAQLRYDGNVFRPVNRFADGVLRLGIEGGSLRSRNIRSGRLDLLLGPNVPLDLELKFGAAEAAVELGGLRVRQASIQTGASGTRLRVSQPNRERCASARFEVGAARFEASGLGNLRCNEFRVSGGVGEVILDFTGEWRQDSNVDVDMGLGALTLRLPRGLGVSVRKSGVLASFDSQGLIKRGDVYYSEDFSDAEYKLVVNIDAALGAIKLQWVDGALGSR